jgi:hypothetical protein
MRALGAQNPGVCPPAGSSLVPLAEVVTPSPSGKRFLSDTNGGYLHALLDAADNGTCSALRTEFSGPKDAAHPGWDDSFNEKENDEAFYGVSVKYPTSAPYTGGWDSAGIFGVDSGSHVHHPSYGGIFRLDGGSDGLTLYVLAGHCPSPGVGFSDSIGTPGIMDWDCSDISPGTVGCSHTTNCNGYVGQHDLLGPGGVRPLQLGLWHDFIFHAVYKARTNGILQVWHRVEGGVWEFLYSNVPGDNALIQVSPHPTMQWNVQWGAPGDPSEAGFPSSMFFQLYRAKPHPTQHLYQSGIRRRQSEAAIKSQFP